jgi:protein gp37
MDWARSLRDHCQAADVPFFFKQAMVNGRWLICPPLDGVVYSQCRRRDASMSTWLMARRWY